MEDIRAIESILDKMEEAQRMFSEVRESMKPDEVIWTF
jgi:hypothetical protein